METNDIVTKNFESYADVAADIINVLLHEGRRRVKDYEMLSAATESLYLDKENGLRNQLEDVAKYHVVNGVPKVLYLFANQTKVDKGMVLRKAGYTGERAGGKGYAVCTGYLMKKGRLQILYGSM